MIPLALAPIRAADFSFPVTGGGYHRQVRKHERAGDMM
jgi:hypothetical protein